MSQITIELSDAQYKALSVVAVSPEEWAKNAVYVRCQNAIEEIVNAEVQQKLQSGEAITGTKEEIVLAAVVETAAERNARQQLEQQIELQSKS
jgi:hypothetical protein